MSTADGEPPSLSDPPPTNPTCSGAERTGRQHDRLPVNKTDCLSIKPTACQLKRRYRAERRRLDRHTPAVSGRNT
jgi:hypothetical protein